MQPPCPGQLSLTLALADHPLYLCAQVAVLVIPFCVIVAWAFGQPLDLDFHAAEAGMYLATCVLAAVVLSVSEVQ